MITQNHKKSKKFKFEEIDHVDFRWDITSEELAGVKEPLYQQFLKNVYLNNPSRYNFIGREFYAKDSE